MQHNTHISTQTRPSDSFSARRSTARLYLTSCQYATCIVSSQKTNKKLREVGEREGKERERARAAVKTGESCAGGTDCARRIFTGGHDCG